MGLISDKKMLSLIILDVLWKHSDERHYLTTKELVNRVLGESIELGRKVSFTYKSVANVVVSPYYLVIYGGRYYCLAYVEDKDMMWHYRVDKKVHKYLWSCSSS